MRQRRERWEELEEGGGNRLSGWPGNLNAGQSRHALIIWSPLPTIIFSYLEPQPLTSPSYSLSLNDSLP
ncbi:unnamed protein product [Nezara viridula]|uniref:Uncharacterized protein n=1 Tax=Nezara viridula TaxID=85310 RepID=A0A9P0E749_NEZVI|nr:unnamed protein product [Nezara viridula]